MERFYLSIPYGIKDTIKACYPIRWDAESRRWYATDATVAVKAQEEANRLVGRELQGISTELRSKAANDEQTSDAAEFNYVGRLTRCTTVNGFKRQDERIAEAQDAIAPGFFETAYTLHVQPWSERAFTLRFGAKSDAEAVAFAKAVRACRLLANLVQGGMYRIAVSTDPKFGTPREIYAI